MKADYCCSVVVVAACTNNYIPLFKKQVHKAIYRENLKSNSSVQTVTLASAAIPVPAQRVANKPYLRVDWTGAKACMARQSCIWTVYRPACVSSCHQHRDVVKVCFISRGIVE